MRGGYNPRNPARDSHKKFVDFLVPGQRLIEAADLIIRVCIQQDVVPPALALYHSHSTHYHSSEEGICSIYLDRKALHSDRFPTQLYHELAHHLYDINIGDTGAHNLGFVKYLIQVLDKDNFKLDYNWRYEYVGVMRLATKLSYLPRDFNIKQWSTLREYNERGISETSG